jgi:hypothetical protein
MPLLSSSAATPKAVAGARRSPKYLRVAWALQQQPGFSCEPWTLVDVCKWYNAWLMDHAWFCGDNIARKLLRTSDCSGEL